MIHLIYATSLRLCIMCNLKSNNVRQQLNLFKIASLLVLFIIISNTVLGQSFDEMKQKAVNGDALAQLNLADEFYKDENMKEALYWYMKSAKKGVKEAQYKLANMYSSAEGTSMNLKHSIFWYKKSAMQGHALSQYKLGVMYSLGIGLSTDINKSIYWYNKSAEQGEVLAQLDLGLLYIYDQGDIKDLKKAAYWISKAKEKGNAKASNIWDEFELYKYQE